MSFRHHLCIVTVVAGLASPSLAGGFDIGSDAVVASPATAGPPPCEPPMDWRCQPDLDGNGSVGAFGDFFPLLAAYGPCPGCPEDLNGDDQVDNFDMMLLLDCFGPCPCPTLGNDEVFNEVVVVHTDTITVDCPFADPPITGLPLLVTHLYATGDTVVVGDGLLAVGQANLTAFEGSTFHQESFVGSDFPPPDNFCKPLPFFPCTCADTFVAMGAPTKFAGGQIFTLPPEPPFSVTTSSITGWWFADPPFGAVDISGVTGNPGQAGVLIAQITLSGAEGGYVGTIRLFNASVGNGGGGLGGGGCGVEVPVSFFGNETPAAGEVTVQAIGDFDGSTFTDVIAAVPVVAGAAAGPQGAVQVFLNQGTDKSGTWLGLVSLDPVTVGVEPHGIAVGLFNMDSFPDVAVTNAGSNSVSILINQGNGDGLFDPPVEIPMVGNRPTGIVAADFTEDGFVDLAVALELDEAVVLLIGDGNGGFAPPAGLAGFGGLGLRPVALYTGDFDGNKCPDVTGAGTTTVAGPMSGQVFVALGQGGGVFGTPTVYNVGVNPLDMAVANLNQDTFPEIVTANNGDGTLTILVNDGTGLFPTSVTVPVGDTPESVEAADLSGDNVADLAVAAVDPVIGPAIQVLINLPDGQTPSFERPTAFPVGADPNFVVAVDLDNDGLADLVTGNTDDGKTGGSVTGIITPTPRATCPWDCAAVPDQNVGINDFLAVLAQWGLSDTSCDFNASGVGIVEFLELLANWGPCP